MNCVTITGTVEHEPEAGPGGWTVILAVPRWGRGGREPGVVYVKVRIIGRSNDPPQEGELIGLTGWVESAAGAFEVMCDAKMVTRLNGR